ncbi:MAG: hypothetical protein V4638_09450 [Bacteroidota bacterium]
MLPSKSTFKNFWVSIIGLLLFKLLIDLMYVIYICPKHNNRGFTYEPSTLSMFFSWGSLLLVLPFLINFFESKNVSSKILTFWVLISFVPTTSIFGFLNVEFLLWELFIVYWLVLLVVMRLLEKVNLPSIPHRIVAYRTIILGVITILLSSVVLFVSAYYFKFRFSLNIDQVTDVRTSFKSVTIPTIFHYLLPTAGTILPIMLLYYLAKRKYIVGVLLLFVLLIDFSIAGNRAIIIKIAVCIFGYFAYKWIKSKYFSWYFSVAILSSLLVYFTTDLTILSSLIRRALFIPGMLNLHYFEFFSHHSPDFYQQGIIGAITGNTSQYPISIATIIGDQFMGVGAGNNANNGLFSDAISNFGLYFLFVQAILVAIYLKLFDWASQSIDEKYAFLPAFIVAQTLLSALITTSMLTHGLLILLLVLLLLPTKEMEKK